MPVVLMHLVKISISLALVYIFYQLLLRRLTFYHWNRFYLLLYSAIALLIPFVDVSDLLAEQRWNDHVVVQWIPVLSGAPGVADPVTRTVSAFNPWHLVTWAIAGGMLILGIRLFVQWLSFRRMIRRAELLENGHLKIYRLDGKVIPFSFGNAIFLNPDLHSPEELREIIRHEFVHARQRHTIDILWGELVCLLNWYNPFAWLIRRAIRQNLEFIADRQVIEHGVDRSQYQYLLLKVIGHNEYRIATPFNFSSLKKRIAMMNKMKSAGIHLLKFLFVLPLVAVCLLAFRHQGSFELGSIQGIPDRFDLYPPADTVPAVKEPNSKGYYIDVIGVNGECWVAVKDANRKEVEKVKLNDWKTDAKYTEQYGEILPPPNAAVAPVPPEAPLVTGAVSPVPPVAPIGIALADCDPVQPAIARAGNDDVLSRVASSWEITDKTATMHLKNGKTEVYDLTNSNEKKRFESKYGRIYNTAADAPVVLAGSAGNPGVVAISPSPAAAGAPVAVASSNGQLINGSEDIIVVIRATTTKSELNDLVEKMKEKGVELKFENVDFNDGKIVSLSGYMRKKDSRSNFTVTDFNALTLAMVEKDGKIWFKVSTREEKIVI
jgi:hypothetical protein